MGDKLKQDFGWIGVGVVAALALIWVGVVIFTGLGYNAFGVPWDFSVTGTLGDSFGVLSSGMAAIAAYFAFGTYRAAQEEGRLAERRAFETSFLNLVERRFDVLDRVSSTQVTFGTGKLRTTEYEGQAALDRIQSTLRISMKAGDKTFEEVYAAATKDVRGLSSYLRYTYHLVSLIDRDSPQEIGRKVDRNSKGYQLVRLLRAQMTDAELLLIANNCVVGGGYAKFRPLVEKYALLHNIPQTDIALFRLDEFFASGAFGLSAADRASPDDMPPQDWLNAMRIDDPESTPGLS